MWRGKPLSANALRDLSIDLEQAGYDSVLLTFHSESPDYLIKSAAALIPGNKLKYMIALRPYHISPQYCAMIVEGFNQIDEGRLVFNWIAGDSHNRVDENLQMDVYGNTENLDSIIKRTTFLRNFIEQYNKMPVVTKHPPMVFSGYSEYTLQTATMFNGTSLCMIDDYQNNIERFSNIKKRMICVAPIILKSSDEVEAYKKLLPKFGSRFLNMCIVGEKDYVKDQLVKLENDGITDILVNTHRPEFLGRPSELSEKNNILINELVKEINTEYGKESELSLDQQ
jgi:alkanesulfonate monooxygenase SsuD/methylene tetrahydromethanopterin reductase-like flavin-dependent oxidoreductase (luciferase family)